MTEEKLLEVKDLSIGFRIGKEVFQAVDNMSFTMKQGKVLGIVGESGSGKSVTVSTIMRLLPPNGVIAGGQILYKGEDLVKKTEDEMLEIRGKEISMIFQDPMTSLNPVFTVENQLVEAIQIHQSVNKQQARLKAIELLELVGIQDAEKRIGLYPHNFSGGMRQRVMIAMAVACNPSLIIADEPTTALDVTVQAKILDLLADLQAKFQTGIIFITHDLEVIRDIADDVIIMYAGEVVESGPVLQIFEKPTHPYTRMLMQSIPKANKHAGKLHVIEGTVTPIKDIKKGSCRFADRIPWIPAEAHEENPQLREIEPGHFVRCTCYQHFRYKEDAPAERREG